VCRHRVGDGNDCCWECKGFGLVHESELAQHEATKGGVLNDQWGIDFKYSRDAKCGGDTRSGAAEERVAFIERVWFEFDLG
jgi:hypothetical protein